MNEPTEAAAEANPRALNVPTTQAEPSSAERSRKAEILALVREQLRGVWGIRKQADENLPWVHDGWIDECEAAGVYSRKPPQYDYWEEPSITVTLTAAEVRLLAQRHLNTVACWEEFAMWTSEDGRDGRARIHDDRFRSLVELLPPEDQQRFQRQLEARKRYVKSVASEVARCQRAEAEFRERVDAGLVSEAEIAAHETPGFIMGLPVMPSPKDGGPGPEEWDMYC